MNIKNEFLEFFKSKNHILQDSAPLVVEDSSLLFVNAGMVQFKDIFTSKITPTHQRATSCQLCLRAGGKHNDLENVGYTRRHHTLFEMLGNFSFGGNGSYFKKEAIDYAYEFIIDILKLPKEKIWVSVHQDDEEAYQLWLAHMPKEKIKKLGDKDNFWQMGDTGPCGPCSEIFYDQGDSFDSSEDYLGGDGDRFLEIWNLVFMQYFRDKDGSMSPLDRPCIDTGMGLERVVAIKEGVASNFDTSLFMPIIEQISNLIDKPYSYEKGVSFRVIADHIRSAIFLISDGVLFEKDGRGYVLRRIVRRAIRHGFLLGFKKPFLHTLVDTVIKSFDGYYPHILDKCEYVKEHILLEEQRFFLTISKGVELFNVELEKTNNIFSGEVAFKLYDTFGFPLDLTEDMLKDKNIKVDIAQYDECMKIQKDKAKASWVGSGDEDIQGDFKSLINKYGLNEFVGYELENTDTTIWTILDETFCKIDTLEAGQKGWVLLEKTPFYALSGGQAGDRGEIKHNSNIAKVLDTRSFFKLNLSLIEVTSGQIVPNDKITAIVFNRKDSQRYHSAIHLLQSALKKILGENVAQAGSFSDNKRLRFDFTYPKSITKEQLSDIQTLVNDMILSSTCQITEVLPIKEAREKGAIAMFGEKYGDSVRVVSFGEHSVEFCGGTHIDNTSSIGSFYITKESSVSSGVRRIEAVCGKEAYQFAKLQTDTLSKAKDILKSADITNAILALKSQIISLKSDIKNQTTINTSLDMQDISGVKVCVDKSSGDIKSIIDKYKADNPKIAIMLFKINGDKVQVACGTKGINVSSRDWLGEISSIIDGKGGGRDDFATGGGKNIDNIKEAIDAGIEFVKNNL